MVGLSPGLVKSNTIKCVFAASSLSTLHKGEGPNTGWQRVPLKIQLIMFA
jgi:hypothetical protein